MAGTIKHKETARLGFGGVINRMKERCASKSLENGIMMPLPSYFHI